jgi:hypothetical protein
MSLKVNLQYQVIINENIEVNMYIKSKLHIPQNAPLHDKDTSSQTYGCRAYNPYICKYCDTDLICAFVTDDKICKSPP